ARARPRRNQHANDHNNEANPPHHRHLNDQVRAVPSNDARLPELFGTQSMTFIGRQQACSLLSRVPAAMLRRLCGPFPFDGICWSRHERYGYMSIPANSEKVASRRTNVTLKA